MQRLTKQGISQLTVDTVKQACIYQLVAKNPNTPTDLLNLGFLFPADFVKNPVLPLLILENPAFIDQNYYTQIINSQSSSHTCRYIEIYHGIRSPWCS